MGKTEPTTKLQSEIKKGYRDERGVRVQKYRRFKEGEDYEAVEAKDAVTMAESVLFNLEQYKQSVKLGQPRKYENVEDFLCAVEDYMKYIRDANMDDIRLIPDIEGLCAYMNISRDTLNEWERSRPSSYSDAIKTVKNQFAFFKKQLALKGKIPPIVFATDFNNNHGYTQKQEITVAQPSPLGDEVNEDELRRRIQGGTTLDAEVVDEE